MNTQELIYTFSDFNTKDYWLPFIFKVTEWKENQDKPKVCFGSLERKLNQEILKVQVKEGDIVGIGFKSKNQEKNSVYSWYQVYFKYSIPQLLKLDSKNKSKTAFIVEKKRREKNIPNFQTDYKDILLGNKSWEFNTLENEYRTRVQGVWYDEPSEIMKENFNQIKVNDLIKGMEINLGVELKECVQELINVVAEMIATEKPCSEKLYQIYKKVSDINKKREIILKRSIEI